MFTRHFVGSVSAISLFAFASACSTLPTNSGMGEGSATDTSAIAKAEWMTQLPQAMSDEICNQESVFLKCYPISEDECHQRITSLTVDCEQKYRAEIPGSMQEEDTARWGGQIGECAGSGMFRILDSKYEAARTEDCRQEISRM